MLELNNQTDWAAALVPGWGADRRHQFTLIVKVAHRFALDGSVEPLLPVPALELMERYHGEPGESSLAAASETVPFKAGSELLLSGTAHPPGQVHAMLTEVALKHGDGAWWRKTLRISGARHWRRTLLGALPSKPEPLAPLPLRYEHAFGGRDEARAQVFAANPVGQGFAHRGRVVDGQPMAQIEQGPKYIRRAGQQPPPAGYGPLPMHWQPRLAEQPELDEEAIAAGQFPFKGRLPPSLFNAAPVDQRFATPFTEALALILSGFFAETASPVHLALPPVAPAAYLVEGGRWRPLTLACDTLSIDTDRREIYRLWRVGIPRALTEAKPAWVVLRDPAAKQEEAAA